MSYLPPTASKPFLARINIAAATAIAAEFIAAVKDADRGRAKKDPSNIAAMLRLPGGPILWDAKLARDADGVNGKSLDPDDGQNDTSWHFANGDPLDSTRHPFLVLPINTPFVHATGLKLGDVAVVIYKNQITGAMFGDAGPHDKLGEASLYVHEGLQPAAPECCHRDENGKCVRIIDASIPNSVVVVAFPGSALDPKILTPDNFDEQIKAHAYDLFAEAGGVVVA